ncbi:mitochondrial 54S ribosomal protein bL9m MRPL50 ASCRUDRAFT_82658 [Ascoidea rubescens DSM 1968]|uniref:Ribosomal protein L9 domain-containing protein n=1 Tax=Ascoidea rubescens DSM 1968 TaxID=1344418 RepID=A0A1D2VA08_9ASCO|nr:hypothetical protein ASCRUDRAFT_82658 [Ascoidea rubescens DSM 1968]ODV58492.1 hypothetical protein ASCRUDRAFT_82658 [Ascoidea rubescens DSM 1968]
MNLGVRNSVNTLVSSPVSRVFVRWSAITRRVKIPVQLLKNFEGIGVAGEIVEVKHSIMRNRLHRYNGAIYLTNGRKPIIPVVDNPKIKLMEKLKIKEQERLKNEQLRKQQLAQEQLKLKKIEIEQKKVAAQKLLTGIMFSKSESKKKTSIEAAVSPETSETSDSKTSPDSAKQPKESEDSNQDHVSIKISRLRTLPPSLLFLTKARESGYLEKNITKPELVKRLYNMTDVKLDEKNILIYYGEKIADRADKLDEFDFVGLYTISINLSGSNTRRQVLIKARNLSAINKLVRPTTNADKK